LKVCQSYIIENGSLQQKDVLSEFSKIPKTYFNQLQLIISSLVFSIQLNSQSYFFTSFVIVHFCNKFQ